MMVNLLRFAFMSLLVMSNQQSFNAFDDEIQDEHVTPPTETGPLPKDKILLKGVDKLTFLRHKRTTSKRTHSIHQLSCVGGTAGCKLFTPDVVECIKVGYNNEKSRYDWKCHADMDDRVQFNHVDIICEGYDYPEDDYILLGSCGLEFTLDYKNPHDHHHQSYHKHMDEEDKELYRKKVKIQQAKSQVSNKQTNGYWNFVNQIITGLTNHMFIAVIFLALSLCSLALVRICTTCDSGSRTAKLRQNAQKGLGYGPLASAVLTTKKAC